MNLEIIFNSLVFGFIIALFLFIFDHIRLSLRDINQTLIRLTAEIAEIHHIMAWMSSPQVKQGQSSVPSNTPTTVGFHPSRIGTEDISKAP